MENFEIAILISNFIAFSFAVIACLLVNDLEIEHNCTRCRLYDAEEEIEKLKAEIEFLKKNNDKSAERRTQELINKLLEEIRNGKKPTN